MVPHRLLPPSMAFQFPETELMLPKLDGTVPVRRLSATFTARCADPIAGGIVPVSLDVKSAIEEALVLLSAASKCTANVQPCFVPVILKRDVRGEAEQNGRNRAGKSTWTCAGRVQQVGLVGNRSIDCTIVSSTCCSSGQGCPPLVLW